MGNLRSNGLAGLEVVLAESPIEFSTLSGVSGCSSAGIRPPQFRARINGPVRDVLLTVAQTAPGDKASCFVVAYWAPKGTACPVPLNTPHLRVAHDIITEKFYFTGLQDSEPKPVAASHPAVKALLGLMAGNIAKFRLSTAEPGFNVEAWNLVLDLLKRRYL